MNVNNKKPEKEPEPATELMKKVAEKAPNDKAMKKVFTKADYDEVQRRLREGDDIDQTEAKKQIREFCRKVKKFAVDKEKAGNNSKLYVFPSVGQGDMQWYKVVEFSALYYVYRLADRMGRTANMQKDSDRFLKCRYVASIRDIGRFVEQMKAYEGCDDPVITEDGVYIFTLKAPVSDEDVSLLKRTEETRREVMHNSVKPKQMDPATFNAVVMLLRQILPRVRKLEKGYGGSIGVELSARVQEMFTTYLDFADGLLTQKEAGRKMLSITNALTSNVFSLGEIRVWNSQTVSAILQNISEIRRFVHKDFNLE